MVVRSLPAVALTISFMDCISRGDVQGLVELMSPDDRLEVFDGAPVVGRDANVDAWRGYFDRFPQCVIYPRRIGQVGDVVAVLGHATGSHQGLPDPDERELSFSAAPWARARKRPLPCGLASPQIPGANRACSRSGASSRGLSSSMVVFSRSVTKATVPAMQEESAMKIPARPEMKFLGKFGGAIVGAVHMTRDTAWEMHPNGDECLHLLSGAVDVVTEEARGGRVTELRAGGACVVPRGRWHRLVVREPGDLLFITPTLGTQHRDVVDPTQSKRDG